MVYLSEKNVTLSFNDAGINKDYNEVRQFFNDTFHNENLICWV